MDFKAVRYGDGEDKWRIVPLSPERLKRYRFDRLIQDLIDGQTTIAWFKGISHDYGKECRQMGIARVQAATQELWRMVNEASS